MYSLIIYQDLTNPCFRMVRVADGSIMTTLTGALSKTTSWANSITTLARDAVIGGIPVTIPEGLPSGDYDFLVYDAAVPAYTDIPVIVKRISWTIDLLFNSCPISIASV